MAHLRISQNHIDVSLSKDFQSLGKTGNVLYSVVFVSVHFKTSMGYPSPVILRVGHVVFRMI